MTPLQNRSSVLDLGKVYQLEQRFLTLFHVASAYRTDRNHNSRPRPTSAIDQKLH